MKIVFPTLALGNASKTRGVGAYTRELVSALRNSFPTDEFIETKGDPYATGAGLVHYPFFDPFYLTLPWHFVLPTLITIHDLIPLKYPLHYPAGYRGRFKWLVQRFRASRAAGIITDSESSAGDICAIMGIPREAFM
jgi:glycosyltransferase involved in cell wall biosynthesis